MRHMVREGPARDSRSRDGKRHREVPVKGSLRQRSTGSWELTVDLGRDPLGRRRRNVKGDRPQEYLVARLAEMKVPA